MEQPSMTAAKSLTRRQFIAGAAGASAAGAAAVGIAHSPAERALGLGRRAQRTPAAPSAGGPAHRAPGHGTLVLVTLYGGNDGENTVVPYHDPAYLAGRPTLGHQANDVIPLDSDLALHPNLHGLKTLWDRKQLAIVRGVGYPEPSHSHFRSMDIWQSGVPETDEATGWLGRWLDAMGGRDPLAAMTLGPTLPKVLAGNTTAGSSVPSGTLTLPRGGRIEAPFAAVEARAPGASELSARIGQSGTDLLRVLHSVADVLATEPPVVFGNNLEGPPAGGATSVSSSTSVPMTSGPTGGIKAGGGTTGGNAGKGGAGRAGVRANPLVSQLDLVARLIKGGLPTRVYVVSMGGFDNHYAEKPIHDGLMSYLDEGITGFVDAMAADPKGSDVVVMTFSEFGRRVAQNASGGTDHGTAAPLFVAGPGVKGGYYGDQPSLVDLDNGDYRFTTDFRSVYATVADRVLGVDPKAVLAGKTFPTLDFV